MVIERYKRDYVFDAGEIENGFQITNSPYLDGDVDLPGFKCTRCYDFDFLLDNTEIEFGRVVEGEAMRYVYDGFVKFLEGEKSDWKVTCIRVEPAKLRFHLQNKKLKRISDIIERGLHCSVEYSCGNFKVPGAMQLVFTESVFTNASAVVEIFNRKSYGRSLKLRQRRQDVTGEKGIDYYEITFGLDDCRREYATVKEWHKHNPERRTTELSWAMGKDGKPDKHHMLGEVELYR